MVSTWHADFINEMYDAGTLPLLVDTAFYLQITTLIVLIGIKLESMMRKDPGLREKSWIADENGETFRINQDQIFEAVQDEEKRDVRLCKLDLHECQI